MKRLVYGEEMVNILIDVIEKDSYYWREQDIKHNGVIPAGHRSHERIVMGNEPEYIEDGVSCCGNIYELLRYMEDEGNDLDTTDIVLFGGRWIGEGLDNEYIVEVGENAVDYSFTLRDLYKCLYSLDIECEGIDTTLKDYMEENYSNEFKKEVFNN